MEQEEHTLILSIEALEASIRHFTGCLSIYPRSERRKILNALHWSRKLHENQKRDSGEPYIIHPLKVAETLIEIKMDPPTIIGALLHDVLEDTDINRSNLEEEFGTEICALVDGVTKINDISIGKNTRKAISLRKMVWAMVEDIRVIIIKLADRLHNMSTLQYINNEQRRLNIARECLEIYAPMAGKIGMNTLKSDLEDFSLKYLKPDYYIEIKDFVILNKDARSRYLEAMKEQLLQAAAKARIKVTVEVRPKHFYSIYRKIKDRNKLLEEINDLLGMRVICESISDCYAMLGVVHQLWKPNEGFFKDYIARPKGNGYQSIHTTVFTSDEHAVEIQIRSKAMHETAEYGVAAHWAYKARKKPDQISPDELAVMKQLQVLKQQKQNIGEFLNVIKQDVLRNSIIVYTPKGEPIELPEGATSIDFAYCIHTDIGNQCMGAKANDTIIPLTRPLQNFQTIQILTSQKAHPHINWLKHVRSTRARSKIRAWLNRHETDIVIGRDIVAQKTPASLQSQKTLKKTARKSMQEVADKAKVGISMENQHNIQIKISRCCTPSPGDRIIGYISRGRGIIVHKNTCPNLKGIANLDERRVHVEWEAYTHKSVCRFIIR
ncbi:MAG: hypothetical protein B0D92_00230, partial [Spirochaeta sp. LUC14_002_19_P3]